jgi:hypothetical protein
MTNLNINPELKKELVEELDYVLMQTTSLAHMIELILKNTPLN